MPEASIQAPKTDPDTDLVYFFHIPKTSGTSLHDFFLQIGDPESVSPPLLWDHLITGRYRIDERTQIITGHFGGLFPLWLGQWPRIITLLREPVARALSHINHVQREEGHPAHALSQGLSVQEYCANPVLRKTVENFQSRYLASLGFSQALLPRPGAPLKEREFGRISTRFEETLYALDRNADLQASAIRAVDAMDAVGICEAHAASLQVFAKALGWNTRNEGKIAEARLNTASGTQRTVASLSRAEVAALERLNEIDIAVYRHALQRFRDMCAFYGIELESPSDTNTKTRSIVPDCAGASERRRFWPFRSGPQRTTHRVL